MENLSSIVKLFTERFVNLTDQEVNLFASVLIRIELKKGEKLTEIGEVAKGLFWVETGLLRQYYFKNGRDITEHFAAERHGIMCIKSLFSQTPSEQGIEALEKSIVYLAPYRDIVALAEQHVNIGIYLRKLFEFVLIVSQEKADSWRFETAKERYHRFLSDFPEAAQRASINHIASYLLMTPESLSRVRSGTL